jgi:uncharacterized protein YdeI (YjbR/CyaY-like superfamily)
MAPNDSNVPGDEVVSFRSEARFRKWVAANHHKSTGVWLRIFKKDSGERSVTDAEALDQALCFGWIDGQKRPFDAQSWLQRFTPRRARSGWSKRNTEHAERLIQAGQMTAAGQAEIAAAKKDGRWRAAYDSPSKATIPADFLTALRKNKKAASFFDSLNKANLYAIAYRLQTAKKPETRQRRMETILAMLARGEKFHYYSPSHRVIAIKGLVLGNTSPTSAAGTSAALRARFNSAASSDTTEISNPPAVCGSNKIVFTSSPIPSS